jgi:hypothetical protein
MLQSRSERYGEEKILLLLLIISPHFFGYVGSSGTTIAGNKQASHSKGKYVSSSQCIEYTSVNSVPAKSFETSFDDKNLTSWVQHFFLKTRR